MRGPIGSCWRILAHEWRGRGKMMGRRVSLHSKHMGGDRSEIFAEKEGQPGFEPSQVLDFTTIFDELVISGWFHLEQMDHANWWMNIGPLDLNVTVGADGKAKFVRISDDTGESCEILWDLSAAERIRKDRAQG